MKRITSYLYFQYVIASDIEQDIVRARGLLDAMHEVRKRSRAAQNWLNRWSVPEELRSISGQ